MGRSRLPLRGGAILGAAAAFVMAVTVVPAYAAEGTIDHVESTDGKLSVLYSLPGVGDQEPDLASAEVSIDGSPIDSSASLASKAGGNSVRRTAILAIDVSDSMQANGKFTQAKRAADIFLQSVPDDLYVGVVTFAGKVTVAQEPTLDRTASKSVIDGLKLSYGTFLYDGLRQAVRTSGKSGQRSIIVLSDGRDTSKTLLSTVTAETKKAGVKVDVVALGQSTSDQELLSPLSNAGGGSVISAADPEALGAVFASEAQTLAKQILITVPLAPNAPREGTLAVSVTAGDQTYTRSAFVTIAPPAATKAASPQTKLVPATPGIDLTPAIMLAGLGAVGLGLLGVLTVALGGIRPKPESIEQRIAAYTGKSGGRRPAQKAPPQGVTAQALDIAGKALRSNRGLEVKLGTKLDASGLALKPAEWLLLHAGIAMGSLALLFLLSGGSIVMAAIGLMLGAVGPWLYLGLKQSKRLKAFNSQLAGTLQLMAGSLQAGLSMPQGMDTIVREGAEPMAGEFRRALVETRLGVPLEDALQTIGERMMSDDFKWTVMAIKIQREVGGNLAELMLNVAATLRERDYLRRQVKSLSAEGRFSAYILLSMPPAILAYEFLTNRTYVDPLITTPIGWVMLAGMVFLMSLGAFMMNRMVKLEV